MRLCRGPGLGWVGSRPHPDARDHGQRPYLLVTTGPDDSRLSGHKACRTVDRPRTRWWRAPEGDPAGPVCMWRTRGPGVSGAPGRGLRGTPGHMPAARLALCQPCVSAVVCGRGTKGGWGLYWLCLCMQYVMIVAKRAFDVTDVNRNGVLDFLKFVHFSYELCPHVPVVPHKCLMQFLREVLILRGFPEHFGMQKPVPEAPHRPKKPPTPKGAVSTCVVALLASGRYSSIVQPRCVRDAGGVVTGSAGALRPVSTPSVSPPVPCSQGGWPLEML